MKMECCNQRFCYLLLENVIIHLVGEQFEHLFKVLVETVFVYPSLCDGNFYWVMV